MRKPMSRQKALELLDYIQANGHKKTREDYGYKPQTLKRRLREIRYHYGLSPRKDELPKVLVFDIETTPIRAFTWGLWKQNINHIQIINDWFVLSWSAKWLFDDKMMSDVLTPKEAVQGNDRRIIKGVWNLLNEADVVIAHNGDKFDLKRLNTRFILHGMNPPLPYQSIDTLKVARKHFSFTSNRLDYLGQLVNNKGKLSTDFALWKNCIEGDKESLEYMVKYNREDVVLLEEVYMFLRSWIKGHPNMGLYVEAVDERCPNCGSDNLDWGGFYVTPANKYQTFRCECGAIGRSRHTSLSKEKRKELTVSIAR